MLGEALLPLSTSQNTLLEQFRSRWVLKLLLTPQRENPCSTSKHVHYPVLCSRTFPKGTRQLPFQKWFGYGNAHEALFICGGEISLGLATRNCFASAKDPSLLCEVHYDIITDSTSRHVAAVVLKVWRTDTVKQDFCCSLRHQTCITAALVSALSSLLCEPETTLKSKTVKLSLWWRLKRRLRQSGVLQGGTERCENECQEPWQRPCLRKLCCETKDSTQK